MGLEAAMRNVKLEGIRYHDDSYGHQSLTFCLLDDPKCQSVEIQWDGGSCLFNMDRLGYTTTEVAEERWSETLAAARLMAAAPDLLEALEEIRKDLSSPDWTRPSSRWADIKSIVRQAIAKAKGGNNE
jgi:hypothetical protein